VCVKSDKDYQRISKYVLKFFLRRVGGEMGDANKILIGKLEGKRSLRGHRINGRIILKTSGS
jgi:hypothetical protein